MTRSRYIAAILALAVTVGAAACSTTGTGTTAVAPLTPAEECMIVQTAANGAAVGLDFAKIKDATAKQAVDAALAGLQKAARDVCAAAAAGQSPDALTTAVNAFNEALTAFHKARQAVVSPAVSMFVPDGQHYFSTGQPPLLVADPGGARG